MNVTYIRDLNTEQIENDMLLKRKMSLTELARLLIPWGSKVIVLSMRWASRAPPPPTSEAAWPTGHENWTVLHSFNQSCRLFCFKVKIYLQDWHHITRRLKGKTRFHHISWDLNREHFRVNFCFKGNFIVKLHQIIWNKPVISTFS